MATLAKNIALPKDWVTANFDALWSRAGEGTVSVLDHEADSTGTADSTSAISAAITAAGEGGSVYFPRGIYKFSSSLTQLSGQRWFGDGHKSILRLSSSVTSIVKLIDTADFAEDYCIENMQIDGNRANITPSVNLSGNFYLLWGPRGGKRGTWRNLLLSNSWGRTLQTSKESASEFAEDILVENVRVKNGGTKGISATQSKRVTISNCFSEIDPYLAADHPGAADAASGSCFECNESHDVSIIGCHGIQIGATVAAPGIRIVNASSNVKAIGNSIEDASYMAFIQNCDDVEFASNIGRDIRGNAIFIGDSDATQPTDTCKRVYVHHNTIIDPDDAYVLIRANKDGYNAYVEAYIHDNHFVQSAGTPTYGIYNGGVEAPATGGECLVYQWRNRFEGTIPNHLAGTASAEIQPEPRHEGGQLTATAANIADDASTINTFDKYAYKQVYDTTNNRMMIAQGSGATDNWISIDGATTVTPA